MISFTETELGDPEGGFMGLYGGPMEPDSRSPEPDLR